MSEEAVERPTGLRSVADRHGVSLEAVHHLVRALDAGHGNMAQFDHPDLGGFGQWSRGGMVMVGRMNDHELKARVDSLCTELAAALPVGELFHGVPGSGNWWPDGLGQPSSVGAQNATRYAYFPQSRRLAVETDGRLVLYDTGGREVTGASQQQGGSGTFAFSGPQGRFSLDDLTPVGTERPDGVPAAQADAEAATEAAPRRQPEAARPADPPPARPVPSPAEASGAPAPVHSGLPRPAVPMTGSTDILSVLERLAELHRKGVLTDAEFSAKKTELLARL